MILEGPRDVLVNGQVFWLNLDSFQGNARLSQSISLLRDITFIVNIFSKVSPSSARAASSLVSSLANSALSNFQCSRDT